MKGELYCPYCYEPINTRTIMFRCPARPSRTGKTCPTAPDPVLRERTGFNLAVGPVFTADGQKSHAQCPDCQLETTTRICPACHATLPVHFGTVNSRLIALVGAKESGKTVFMTVLVHELMNKVGRRLDAAMSGADDRTRERFAGAYEGPLYGEKRLLGATTAATRSGREPMVFRFTTEERRRLGSPVPRHTLLSFFDTAGEDLTSKESVEENVRYLAEADGIVLLLDPLQMPGARALAAPSARLPAQGAVADDPANVLERITDLVSPLDGGSKRKISRPLAIAFSKLDALDHNLKETSPLRRPAPTAAFFDETDSQEVHAEIRRLLSSWDGDRIDHLASKHYEHFRYFGLSALGGTPTAENKVNSRGIRPYRVADPFLWALGGFGAIKVKKGS